MSLIVKAVIKFMTLTTIKFLRQPSVDVPLREQLLVSCAVLL